MDLDLLRREMDTLWGLDLYGRPLPAPPLVALALAEDGHEVRFETGAAPALREAVGETLAREPSLEAFRACCERLIGSVNLQSGPSYVFERRNEPAPARPDLEVVTSAEPIPSWVEEGRPDPWGDSEEWRDLVAGRLGPWAVGGIARRVVSVCYTPVASPQAAEAGIWTLPEARGRGYAPEVVGAWASVAAQRFGTLFYSTGSDNTASQAVARKLGLRCVGTLWQVR